MGIKRTKEEIEKIVNNNGYKLLKEYRNGFNALRVTFQDSYGYKYDTLFTGILSGYRTRIVSKFNPFTLENLSLWLKLHNKNFSLTGNNFYINSSSPNLEFLCAICKEIFCSSWIRLYTECGCPFCAGKKVSKTKSLSHLRPDLAKEWHLTKNNGLIPENISIGSNRKIWWVCYICNYVWKSVVYKRVNGSGCPKCSESMGERRIRIFLENINISFIFQKKYIDCRNLLPLPFDFYLLKYNTCIEYQGRQHYFVFDNDYFGDENNLLEVQKRDKIKFDYCKNNNIPLIVIPFWDYDNIENILEKELLKYA